HPLSCQITNGIVIFVRILMSLHFRLFLFGAIFTLSAPVLADNWSLDFDRNNIKVYTKQEKGSAHLHFKGVSVYATTIERALEVMRDVSNMHGWLYSCYEPKLLKEEGENSRLVYMKNSTPTFFISDRDLILRQLFDNPSEDYASLNLLGLPNEIEPVDGLVRIPHFQGLWEFRKVNQNEIEITYSGSFDPGGKLPTSITNLL